jgi:hypothetical protein
MPTQLSSWHTDPVILRLVAAIVAQHKATGMSVSASCRAWLLVLVAANPCSYALLLVAARACCQTKALFVESARTLASTYNVGIPRTGVKDRQAAVEAEAAKGEDLSEANWNTAAELAKVVARHPGAATPFTPEYIDTNYPAYRASQSQKKMALQQVVCGNMQQVPAAVTSTRAHCLLHVTCVCACYSSSSPPHPQSALLL